MMRLPDSYRITFEMSRYQDKTYKEIAERIKRFHKISGVSYPASIETFTCRTKRLFTVDYNHIPLFSLRIADSFLSLKIKNAAFN